MMEARRIIFDPFQLDTVKKRLWKGEQEIRLRPMAAAVLQTLLEHAGDVMPKEDLLKRVWAGTYVTKTALKVCIREIRQALGDTVVTPHYIETVGQQGYRFVGRTDRKPTAASFVGAPPQDGPIVGRAQDVALLSQWLAEANRGVRQCVFLTGEAGIGKTTLVDLFLTSLHADDRVHIAYGQCLEQYGEGEAYLPILEALGRLCQEPGSARLMAILRRCAPSWVVQMPSLLEETELAHLQQQVHGVTRQRMLREIAEALEAVTAERLLILTLQDVQWSDYSTLELIAYLARRREQARLMIVGTYRPTGITSEHPLIGIHQELQAHQLCKELPVKLLTESDVATYLALRSPDSPVLAGLAGLIHQCTDGNALFMINVVNTLTGCGLGETVEGFKEIRNGAEVIRLPDTLRQLIEHQVWKLHPEDRHILEAGSVTGREFVAAAVAAALGKDAVQIEERCTELVRHHQFIQMRGEQEWPDGTITTRYSFIHALYHEVLYRQLTAGKRAQLHRLIGKCLEQAYGARSQEIIAELTVHFDRGGDYPRALQYLCQAIEQTSQRGAYREALHYLTRALEVVKILPATPERVQYELMLQIHLGVSLLATKGYASPEAKAAFDYARQLCQQAGETSQLVPVLRGLAAFYYVRAELLTARDFGEQSLQFAQRQHNEDLLLEAYQEIGGTCFSLGEFGVALSHFEHGLRLYDFQKHRSHAVLYGQDPGVSCLSRSASTLWFLGYPDQALTKNQEALALAEEVSHPHSLAYALSFAAGLHQVRGEAHACQARAEAAIKLADEQGFPIWTAMGTILRGWAIAEQGQREEGITEIQKGIASWRTIGAEISSPYYLALLAETYARAGQISQGLHVVAEALALAHKTADCWWEAELYRLNGEMLSQQAKDTRQPMNVYMEAAACFHRALEIARRQRAMMLELRAAMSLGRLWLRQGEYTEARGLLKKTYAWFTEGFTTGDLQHAKALLAELNINTGMEESSPRTGNTTKRPPASVKQFAERH